MLIAKRQAGQPQGAFKLRTDIGFTSFILPGAGADLVTGAPIVITGTVTTPGMKYGRAFVNSAGAKIIPIVDASKVFGTDGGMFLVAGYPTATGSNNYGTLAGTITNDNQRFQVSLPYSNGYYYFDFGGTSGANRLSASGITYNEKDVWVFSAGSRGMEIWRNGLLVQSSSTPVTRSQSTGNWGFQGDPGVWYAAACSNKELSKELCAALSRDLWGTAFVQRRRGIINTLAAAARRRIVMWG